METWGASRCLTTSIAAIAVLLAVILLTFSFAHSITRVHFPAIAILLSTIISRIFVLHFFHTSSSRLASTRGHNVGLTLSRDPHVIASDGACSITSLYARGVILNSRSHPFQTTMVSSSLPPGLEGELIEVSAGGSSEWLPYSSRKWYTNAFIIEDHLTETRVGFLLFRRRTS